MGYPGICNECSGAVEVVSRRHGGLGIIVTTLRCTGCGGLAVVRTETPGVVSRRFRETEERRIAEEVAMMRLEGERFVDQLHAGVITPSMFAVDDRAA
jgi:hypothetical protein